MASGLPGNRSSGKLQDQAILLQLYVWSSRPGRSFMVSGTVIFICKPGQPVIAEGVQNALPGMHQADVSKLREAVESTLKEKSS
jgi:hypothetical protein